MPLSASDLVAALPWPVVLIDRSERIELVNEAARALFGHDGTGRHYITALRQPATLDAIEGALRDGAPREARYLEGGGGQDTTWRVAVRAVGAGSARRVLVAFEDMTAVEEAGQIRRDFVANVSHELRTPLTALLGFIETLRGPARDDAAARDRFLRVIAREADRMARLVNDLLSLSRVEADERRRPQGRVDLAELIRASATRFEPLAALSGASLSIALPEVATTVPGDEEQLGQVLANLIENAIKYGGGEVAVTLTGPAEEPALRRPGYRIEVVDRGDGIAPHHIPRLTERFYRVDDHRSREVGGTGLGLAIVKHIVNRHRGRLRIESAPGAGSRFTVVLPAD